MNLIRVANRRASVRRLVMASGILLPLVALLAWLMIGREDLGHTFEATQSPSKIETAHQRFDQGASAEPIPQLRPKASTVGAAPDGSSPLLLSDYEDRLADSPEEAEWLRLHGYPSLSEIEIMNGLSLDQLSDMAKAGDRLAQVFLGTRLALAERDFDGGIKTLESAAMNDSVYALTALASVHEASGNVALAQGYRIAALLRGDYETAFVHNIVNNFSNAASPQWELSLGFPAGQAIIDRLNQARVAQGIGVFPPATPRPGAEVAYERALQELERLGNEGTEGGQAAMIAGARGED